MKKTLSSIVILLTAVFAVSYFESCRKLDIVTSTTSDVNIYSYLVQNPDRFSEFVKILNKTGYNDFLDAYGSYTVFAPDNNAVKNFLQESGKASIEAFTDTELKNIVKLHLIQDTINTSSFKDG